MEQRSKEWFGARIGRVTGSNVGAILGCDPNRGPDDVMRAMVRAAHGAEAEFTGNVATEYGTFHEAGARAEFEMEHGLAVKNAGFVKHADWLGASPDGFIDSRDALLEIKCPYSLRDAEEPVPFKTLADQPHYYAQVQIQLAVTKRPAVYFFQWAPRGTKLEIIERDDDFIDEIIPKLYAFWLEYKYEAENNADEHLQPKRKQINTLEAERLVAEYDELADAADHAKERMAEIKQRLIHMAGEQNAEVCGRKLTKVEKAGSVSYAKVVKENLPDVDLEPYRGKPSVSWRFA